MQGEHGALPLPPTPAAIEGPFYRPGAPFLEEPYALIRRAGERGARLLFHGWVVDTGGRPLAGAIVDLWQASAEGLYSPGSTAGEFSTLFDQGQPAFNMRGRLLAGENGSFEVATVIPGAYRDPPGSLDEADMRPAHLHAKVSHPGFAPLTTQLFFAEDPHLASDPAEAVRPGLVMDLEREQPLERQQPQGRPPGLLRPTFACSFTFVLDEVLDGAQPPAVSSR